MIASSSLALTLVLQATPSIAPPATPETQVPASLHWFDLDGNGELDALAVEPAGGIRLLRHEGGGLFTEETSAWGLEGIEGVTGVLVGDPDGDGATDLVLSTTRGLRVHLQSIGAFVDVTPGAGLEGVGPVASVGWVDANGDRRADLHVVTTCGHRVFLNEGGGAFAELDFGLVASDSAGAGAGAGFGAASPGDAGAGATSGTGDAPRSPLAAAGSPNHLQTGAARRPSVSAQTVSLGGGVSVASTPGTAPLDLSTCAQTVFDLGSGSCVQTSSVPTAGMLYPLGPELMIDAVTGHVGVGTMSPGYALEVAGQIVGGTSNSATGVLSAIVGGEANSATGLGAFIGGGLSNLALSDRAVVSGGVGNRAAYRSFVGGGDNNAATGNVTAIAGGKLNDALQTGAFVGGGELNVSDAPHAAVAGGKENSATGEMAFVGGGGENAATGTLAFVGGGGTNSPGIAANRAEGLASAVAGGQANVASGAQSSVLGGFGNDATDAASTVGGGSTNLAGGRFSTVPGGRSNTADGDYSLAAGRAARALHDGSFVWSDQSTGALESTAPDQFLIRAGGGVGIGTNDPAATLHVQGANEAVRAWSTEPDFGIGLNADASGTNGIGVISYGGAYSGYFIGKMEVTGGTDVTTVDGGFVQVGESSQNIAIDGNEIMARDATGAAVLNLNADGDDVALFANGNGNLLIGDELTIREDEIDHVGGSFEVQSSGSMVVSGGTSVAVDAGISLDLNGLSIDVDALANLSLTGATTDISAVGGSMSLQAGTARIDLLDSAIVLTGGSQILVDGYMTDADPDDDENGPWVDGQFSLALQALTAPCCSDLRWKRNVEPLGISLDQLLRLHAKAYFWNETSPLAADSKKQFGYIAQEVLEVFPNLVKDYTDDEHYLLDYTGLIPVIVEGLRELRAEKDSEIAELREQVRSLRADLEQDSRGEIATLRAAMAERDETLAKMRAEMDELRALITAPRPSSEDDR